MATENTATEHAARIQTSLLNPYEKVVLNALVRMVPRWITSDHLSLVGLLGAVVIALGYALTAFGPEWLWLTNFGFVMNWLGDSLDGTLARYRQQQRPLYGFYLDHNLDCICEFLMVFGAGLSVYLSMSVALLIIVPYLMLEVYVMINAHLKNEFRLTYAKLGPTELRLIIILANAVLYFVPALREWRGEFSLFGQEFTLLALDIAGLAISVSLVVIYIVSIVQDARYFARIDPLPKRDEQ